MSGGENGSVPSLPPVSSCRRELCGCASTSPWALAQRRGAGLTDGILGRGGSLASSWFVHQEMLAGGWRDEEGNVGGSSLASSSHRTVNRPRPSSKDTARVSQPHPHCWSHWIPVSLPQGQEVLTAPGVVGPRVLSC